MGLTGDSRPRPGVFSLFSTNPKPTVSPLVAAKAASIDCLDEFAGLSFASLLSCYLPTSTNNPSTATTPDEAIEEVVTTATQLLERVYTAYKARSAALADALAETEIKAELLANEQTRAVDRKNQLEKLAAEEAFARDAREKRILAQDARIAELERELAERERWGRGKRSSTAASDSGFESDGESMFSSTSPVEERDDSSILSPRLEMPDESRGGSLRRPTPTRLRESWSSEASVSTVNSERSVWSIFKKNPAVERDTRAANEVRTENRRLRMRVGELEAAVEGALEAVAGRLQ